MKLKVAFNYLAQVDWRRRALVVGVTFLSAVGTQASTLVPQTAIPGDCIPQFATPLPVFGPAGGTARVNALAQQRLRVTMREIEQQVLPAGDTDRCGLGIVFRPTRLWAYETANALTGALLGAAHWPGVTIEAHRFLPTTVEYLNALPSFDAANPHGPGLVQGLLTVDQTIHWANPPATDCVDGPPRVDCETSSTAPYTSVVPAVVHLHGAEVPSAFDGGPQEWFAQNGATGGDYRAMIETGPGTAVYHYPNAQQPGTLWFHDHALGTTRTNVYAGLAAFYFVRDPATEPRALPTGRYEIEMAIQDRQFDMDSQLFWPDGSGPDAARQDLNGPPTNPGIHPFWIPEFIGDVVTVNGAAWPFLDVEPRRYRFRLLNGSNARFYRMRFGDAATFQIGADDAYLDRPAPVDQVFLAPGERADVIVDFSSLAGREINVANDAPVPFPDGLLPGVDQPGMASIMQLRVGRTRLPDRSCDPVVSERAGSGRRMADPNGDCTRPVPTVRLTDGQGHLAPGVAIARKRQLVLKEFATDGGPVEVLLNNTQWDGLDSPQIRGDFPDGITERPRIGSTELWEVVNLTGDAHPIHTHLAQFQILNRERFAETYLDVWGSAFGGASLPTGCHPSGDPQNPCPGFGPPLPYGLPNPDGALGGNPAISPFLMGNPTPPPAEEAGWKDTAKAMPGEVLRLVVRWAPTVSSVQTAHPGRNLYPFDPTEGPGYVWHCHILDHEDNEMMRPYKVVN
jgi:FtsP/CotA-like multicopper oxidase with cupredoxin domain